jgi:hypothetical protein
MLPAWIASQRKSRLLCERCGKPATAEVTFAGDRNGGRTEMLCRKCWDADEEAKRS